MMQLHSRGLSVGAGMTGLHTTTLLPSFHKSGLLFFGLETIFLKEN